jgi:hypothetical protein
MNIQCGDRIGNIENCAVPIVVRATISDKI